MKIYHRPPTHLIRLIISRIGDKKEYLTLCDTTLHETFTYVNHFISAQHLHRYKKGYKTSITIRECIDSKNGKALNISFRGRSPKEILNLITEDLTQEK